MVDDDALAAAALPDPNEEAEQPGWMLRGAAILLVSNANDGSQFVPIKNDISGQRKFQGNNSSLVFLVNNGGTGTISVHGIIRYLVKKP